MNPSTVMAILVDKRTDAAPKVQEILTNYGCLIQTRLGMHEVDATSCSEEGLIIIRLCGEETKLADLKAELEAVHDRVKVERIDLSFGE